VKYHEYVMRKPSLSKHTTCGALCIGEYFADFTNFPFCIGFL